MDFDKKIKFFFQKVWKLKTALIFAIANRKRSTDGRMAERLGSALQKLPQRFESASDLNQKQNACKS